MLQDGEDFLRTHQLPHRKASRIPAKHEPHRVMRLDTYAVDPLNTNHRMRDRAVGEEEIERVVMTRRRARLKENSIDHLEEARSRHLFWR